MREGEHTDDARSSRRRRIEPGRLDGVGNNVDEDVDDWEGAGLLRWKVRRLASLLAPNVDAAQAQADPFQHEEDEHDANIDDDEHDRAGLGEWGPTPPRLPATRSGRLGSIGIGRSRSGRRPTLCHGEAPPSTIARAYQEHAAEGWHGDEDELFTRDAGAVPHTRVTAPLTVKALEVTGVPVAALQRAVGGHAPAHQADFVTFDRHGEANRRVSWVSRTVRRTAMRAMLSCVPGDDINWAIEREEFEARERCRTSANDPGRRAWHGLGVGCELGASARVVQSIHRAHPSTSIVGAPCEPSDVTGRGPGTDDWTTTTLRLNPTAPWTAEGTWRVPRVHAETPDPSREAAASCLMMPPAVRDLHRASRIAIELWATRKASPEEPKRSKRGGRVVIARGYFRLVDVRGRLRLGARCVHLTPVRGVSGVIANARTSMRDVRAVEDEFAPCCECHAPQVGQAAIEVAVGKNGQQSRRTCRDDERICLLIHVGIGDRRKAVSSEQRSVYFPRLPGASMTFIGDDVREYHETAVSAASRRSGQQTANPFGDVFEGLHDALRHLDVTVKCPTVRAAAVGALCEGAGDERLKGLLPQLIQAIKHDPYHDSALIRTLLCRAIVNPIVFGRPFFWNLHSEAAYCRSAGRGRHAFRLELVRSLYLEHCGQNVRGAVMVELEVTRRLSELAADARGFAGNRIARLVVGDVKARQAALRRRLKVLGPNLPSSPLTSLALRPGLPLVAMVPSLCRIMKSKKNPVWLCFQAAAEVGSQLSVSDCGLVNGRGRTLGVGLGEGSINHLLHVIVKSGDDLRQDALICQALSEMERMWRCDGLDRDICLTPYRVVSTGHMTGMIEAVVGAETVADLMGSAAVPLETILCAKTGAERGARALTSYLKKWNPKREDYEAALARFRGSCAGYCVATYLLGVADRHGDNVMLVRDGRLFHVDFGHMLGDVKKKFGMAREAAPFSLTPDLAQVIGG